MKEIIEDKNQLDELFNLIKENGDIIIIPVLSDINKHPKINEIFLFYFYIISLNKFYIIPLNTNDCINIYPIDFENFIKNIFGLRNNKFVLNKKELMHILFRYDDIEYNSVIDIKILNYFLNTEYDYSFLDNITTPAHQFIYRKYFSYKFNNLNKYIPITKHIERLNKIVDKILIIINNKIDYDLLENFNSLFINVLFNIEKNGIYVDEKKFQRKDIISENNLIYTEYNFLNLTSRPVCSYKGYSFSSINKNDSSRESIISRFGNNGRLLLFDYKSYHIYLIAELIGEKFDENPHDYFAKLYLNKSNITEDEYKKCKEITFKLIYGNIPEKFLKIKFFNKVNEFISTLWNLYNSNGYIFTRFFKRKLNKKFLDSLDSMTPSKLFNYYLQSMETENNMIILNEVFNYLNSNKNLKSKIILYVYDSILIDFNIEDGKNFIKDIVKILEQNKYKVDIKCGKDYKNMIKI